MRKKAVDVHFTRIHAIFKKKEYAFTAFFVARGLSVVNLNVKFLLHQGSNVNHKRRFPLASKPNAVSYCNIMYFFHPFL